MADPMYRRIAEELQRKIRTGELPPGSQLPTELELRDEYDASRNTIRDAVKWLIQRGYVATQPGRGTFVADKIVPFVVTLSADPKTGFGGGEGLIFKSEAEAHGRAPETSEPRVEIQRADAELAQALRIQPGDQVVSRHQERRIDGTPWSLQTSFYPMSLVQEGAPNLILATDMKPGVVAYLKEELGIEQVGYRDVITVRGPNEFESSFFRLSTTGTISVLQANRTAYDQSGRPFRLTVTVFPGDRNQLAFNVGSVPDEVINPEPDPEPAGRAGSPGEVSEPEAAGG